MRPASQSSSPMPMRSSAPVTGTATGEWAPLAGRPEAATPALTVLVVDVVVVLVVPASGGAGLPADLAASPLSLVGTGAAAGTVYFGVWVKDAASPGSGPDAYSSTPVAVT